MFTLSRSHARQPSNPIETDYDENELNSLRLSTPEIDLFGRIPLLKPIEPMYWRATEYLDFCREKPLTAACATFFAGCALFGFIINPIYQFVLFIL